MIIRNLWHHKARSLLTMFGIAIGVATVISLGAMAEGFVEGYSGLATGSGADLIVTQAESVDISLSNVDEEVGSRIAQLPGVRSVSGVILNIVQVEGIPYFIVGGYDPEGVAIRRFRILEGHALTRDREILLGYKAADSLSREVGDTIRLYDNPFRIVGIYETGQALEDAGAVVSLADAQAIFRMPRRVTYFEVQVWDPTQIETVQSRIQQLIRDVTVSSAADVGDRQVTVQSMRAIAWGISFIAILIGGLGMMNTMIMSVFEQTRDIGVLRALGWSRGQVLRLVLNQSLALSLAGGVVGLAMGLGLVDLINRTPAISSFAPAKVEAALLAQGMGVALMLGLVGGLYPAWRASNLSPTEALRYDGGSGDGREPPWAHRLGRTFRNLLRRRTRSLLTVGGIAIGVGLIFSLGAIVQGMIESFTDFASRGGAELVATQAGVADMGYSVIDERVGRAVAAMPEVQDVSGIVWGVSQGEGVPYVLIMGLEPGSLALQQYRLVEGERIRGRGEVMLGASAAESLNMKVGDALRLPGGVFRVTGIYESSNSFEDSGGVVALPDAQAAFQKPRQLSLLQIKVRDPDQVERVRALIEERFGDEIAVSVTSKFMEDSSDIENTRAMLGAVFTLAILVGGVVVANTMIMAVMERTREIGTLRALGWRRSRILWLILSESLLLSLVAAGCGIVVGIAFVQGLGAIPGYGAMLSPRYTLGVVAQAVGVALFLGAAGGLYPAWRASRLSPVEALRYE